MLLDISSWYILFAMQVYTPVADVDAFINQNNTPFILLLIPNLLIYFKACLSSGVYDSS